MRFWILIIRFLRFCGLKNTTYLNHSNNEKTSFKVYISDRSWVNFICSAELNNLKLEILELNSYSNLKLLYAMQLVVIGQTSFNEHWTDSNIIFWTSDGHELVHYLRVKLRTPNFSQEQTDTKHQTLFDLSLATWTR